LARDSSARARHLARELLVKALYQWQIAGHSAEEIVAQFGALPDYERCDREFFGELLPKIVADVASLDAVIELRNKHKLAPKDIARIRIATYQGGLDVVDNFKPEGDYQAKFSLPYVVAHALIHGSVRLNAFGPDRLNDPQLRALMAKVELSADPELSRAFPRQRAARVEIETTDGRKLSHFQETRKGDPELPLSDAELNDKYLELAAPVLGDASARALLKDLWALETLETVEFDRGERVPAHIA